MTTLFINEEEVTVSAGTSILEACSQYDLAFSFACSAERGGRVEFLPDGSPIIAVKSPIIKIA